jgi:zinc transporter ZupT
MKTQLDMMRVWAAITGLVLVALVFVQMAMGMKITDTLPMLAASIAGFELFLFAQELVNKRKGRRG